ncbi:hypothetical protein OAE71_02650 [Synechococcus sp. AH-551-A21]|nr:hypothetical protein [Synechococcus sp. AH-551-A21]MDB4678041.1 hypothetical protein [Synechococcus sp. AH-551-A21]
MHKSFSFVAIGLASMLSLPAVAMPTKFKDMDNATFCSVDNDHSVVLLDNDGNTNVRSDQNACITLSKIEDLWKVRIEWWSVPMNKRFVEYSLAGWINPQTLAYIESSSIPTNSKIVGEGHIRYIDKDTINVLQFGVLEDGSAAMFSENFTRVDSIPTINIPLQR